MANSIQYTHLNPANGYVGSSSRYIDSEIIYYGRQNKITFNLYRRKPHKASSSDQHYVIPPGYAYRPDMVSYIAYGVPDYWWVIMEANGIRDVMDFVAGINLWIPGDIHSW